MVWRSKNTTVGICHTDHVAPSIHKKLALTSLTSGGRLVGIVRSWTQPMEFVLFLVWCDILKVNSYGIRGESHLRSKQYLSNRLQTVKIKEIDCGNSFKESYTSSCMRVELVLGPLYKRFHRKCSRGKAHIIRRRYQFFNYWKDEFDHQHK
jgi:hypothetical protein